MDVFRPTQEGESYEHSSQADELKTALVYAESLRRGFKGELTPSWISEELLASDPKHGFLSFYRSSRQNENRSLKVFVALHDAAAIQPLPVVAALQAAAAKSIGPRDDTVRGEPTVVHGHGRDQEVTPHLTYPPDLTYPTAERVAGSDLWRGLRRLFVGAFAGLALIMTGGFSAAIEIVMWPVSVALIVMGLGLLATFAAFAADIRRTAQTRYFMIVEPPTRPFSD